MRKLWQHTTTIVTLLLFSMFVVQSTQITQLCQAMSECGESCCCSEGCHDASDEITCCEAPSHTATSDLNFELVKQTEAGIALAVISAFRISPVGSDKIRFSHLGTSSLSKLSATNSHALLQAFLI